MNKMKFTYKIIVLIIAALLVASNVFLFIKTYEKEEIAFVNISALMDEFNYAKELEKRYNDVLIQRENEIETKKVQLNKIATENQEITEETLKKYERIESELQNMIEAYYDERELLEAEYNQLIIERINKYVYEYGKENNKKIILGATGDGSIMYAEEGMDITDDVLSYINSKYEGE